MGMFKRYQDIINESLIQETDKDKNLDKPIAKSGKFDIYKPKEGNDKAEHRLINPVTNKPITMKAYLGIIQKIKDIRDKKIKVDPDKVKETTALIKDYEAKKKDVN